MSEASLKDCVRLETEMMALKKTYTDLYVYTHAYRRLRGASPTCPFPVFRIFSKLGCAALGIPMGIKTHTRRVISKYG